MLKKIMSFILLLAVASAFSGCSKNGKAKAAAERFIEDMDAGHAYKSSHLYVQDNVLVEVHRDKDGRILVVYDDHEGLHEEFYRIGDELSWYINGVRDAEHSVYTMEEAEEFFNGSTGRVPQDPRASLEVFDLDIASDVVKSPEKKAYVAVGKYEDDSVYSYSYGIEGGFFELIDAFDRIRIDLDDAVEVKKPD